MALGFSTEILSFFLLLFGQRISGTTSCLLLFTKWHSADLQLPMPSCGQLRALPPTEPRQVVAGVRVPPTNRVRRLRA